MGGYNTTPTAVSAGGGGGCWSSATTPTSSFPSPPSAADADVSAIIIIILIFIPNSQFKDTVATLKFKKINNHTLEITSFLVILFGSVGPLQIVLRLRPASTVQKIKFC